MKSDRFTFLWRLFVMLMFGMLLVQSYIQQEIVRSQIEINRNVWGAIDTLAAKPR